MVSWFVEPTSVMFKYADSGMYGETSDMDCVLGLVLENTSCVNW